MTETVLGTIPNIWIDAVEPMREFYIDKLGFQQTMGVVGKDGKLDFAIVQYQNVQIMLGRPERPGMKGMTPDPDRPVQIYCYISDVDAYYADLEKRRVPIVTPIATEWWGDRVFTVKDPYGYALLFSQSSVAELNPPAGVKMV